MPRITAFSLFRVPGGGLDFSGRAFVSALLPLISMFEGSTAAAYQWQEENAFSI